jgi:predicted DsbA family dithiol-disulfide isomerase
LELYRVPKPEPATLRDLAATLKLDLSAFERCRNGEAIEEVRRDTLMGDDLGLRSTPGFLFGRVEGGTLRVTRTLAGSQPLVAFQKTIEEALAQTIK